MVPATGGCDATGGGGGGPGGVVSVSDPGESEVLAASAENVAAVAAALDTIDRLLEQGVDTDTVYARLVETLQENARVAGAGIDPDGDVVWADFVDGEIRIFQVIDEAADDEGQLLDDDYFSTSEAGSAGLSEDESVDPLDEDLPDGVDEDLMDLLDQLDDELFGAFGDVGPVPKRQGKVSPLTAQLGAAPPADYYHMPASRKVLLANALTPFHAEWAVTDATGPIGTMLESCGYENTDSVPLTLDLFDNLGDYGVILLEAHGAWRDPTYSPDDVKLPPGLVSEDHQSEWSGSCGGLGSRQVLLTTTKVTGQNLAPRGGEILCGHLAVWTVTLRHPDKRITKQDYYGVTANYVRKNVQKFPNYTLFVLNACRGLRDDVDSQTVTASPFGDVLFEKCDEGATFLGWKGRPRYPYAYRAVLNLFQYATAAGLEVVVKNHDILKPLDPPWGGFDTSVCGAWKALRQRSPQAYNTDPRTGATLEWVDQDSAWNNRHILMPHPLGISFDEDGKHVLSMKAEGEPEVTVGSARATVTRRSDGIGLWDLRLPVGAVGELRVTDSGRMSVVPRTVHRWRPQIQITRSDGAMQCTVNLTLVARATVDGMRVWASDEAPPPTFGTAWEKEASNVSWQASGEETGDLYKTKWTGSGLRTFGDGDRGEFWTDDGVTAALSVGAVGFPYTVTETNLETGEVETWEEIGYVDVWQEVPLTSTWTVAAQSYTDGDDLISWSAFAPEPTFSNSTEAR